MFKLPFLIPGFSVSLNILGKSPHGDKFSIMCDVCHDQDSWAFKSKNNTFDHQKTSFPLVGQHKMVSCRKCHSDLDFSKAKICCIACHNDVHQQTVGWDCERCHTTNDWMVSKMTEKHQQTRFPLNGKHALADCVQCHKSASRLCFDPQGVECIDCHSKDYNATTNPAHLAGKYPTTCETCHTVTAWAPSTFNHASYFTITNSRHNVSCATCHTNPANYSQFTCYTASCHAKAVTDSHHTSVRNYVYNSVNCYSCHPQ